jgi:hypothetical protein
MEALYIEEKNTTSLVKPRRFDEGIEVSTIFNSFPVNYLIWNFKTKNVSLFFNDEMIGTTVYTIKPDINIERVKEDYEIGYYNDNYDIVAKPPVKMSFKVKVKIRSIAKHQSKSFID